MTEIYNIHTEKAPLPIGLHSQAVVTTNGTIYTSGQIALLPSNGRAIVQGGIRKETYQVLENLRVILEAAGSGLDMVVKATIFLRDLDDFAAMNDVFQTFFPETSPVCSTIQAIPPLGALVEIELIAIQ